MNNPWSRSADGALAGVCKGLATRFSIDMMLVRLAWLFAVLFFGFGIGAYFVLAVGLPRSDKLMESYSVRILGTCSRFARRFDLDVGLTRVGFTTLLICSGGIMFIAYIILYYILPKESELSHKSSGSM